MGQKNDGGTNKPKIVLRATPKLIPASAKPDPDNLYDIERLSSLPREDLIKFVASECKKHRVSSAPELFASPELKPLAGAARLAGIVDEVFAEKLTRVEKSPHAVERPTVRPPPRQAPDAAPAPSVRAGTDHVSGVEDTVAVVSGQQPVHSKPPPAPKTLPPPVKFDFVDIDSEKQKIYGNNSLRTRQAYEKLNELMLAAATKAAELHAKELVSLKAFCDNDQKKLVALQESAMKAFQSGAPIPGPEARFLELAYTKGAVEAILKYPAAELEARNLPEPDRQAALDKLAEDTEKKIEAFTQYLNTKIARGKPGRLEKYVDQIIQFRKLDVLEKKKTAEKEDKLRVMQASRNGGKAVEREKTPRSAMVDPAPDEPAFVRNDDGKRISSVPPVAERQSQVPPGTKEPGRLRRFFTNPMTWTLGGIAGFSSALVYRDSFREIAQALTIIWHDKLHRPEFDFTKTHVILGYAGVMLFTLATTELFRRRAVRKKAQLYTELGNYSIEEREREKRVVAKLTKITLEHDKWEEQVDHLRIALVQDPQFMEDLYEMKRHRLFNDILADARIHPRIVQNLNLIFERVKKQKLEKRLNKLAEVLFDPKERIGLFSRYLQEDPIVRRAFDELFEQNGSGNYVNMDRQNEAFAAVFDHTDKNVGKELQKALQNDYIALKSA
ncbi:MAG TPA: hypothetical protein VLD37_06320 [Candidatus Bilamarchaeum sp.]|nr:hypothetical protein [Candidatus Bilamarchaeum sp.]